ncbi:uncharacterized protein LOC120435088 isoform X1 [Oreochromis aureus]|uniref:uncharacterized protein LOC120435088 isoform X1 n=1 Tax=Oreochromis aureus TaxID=47969 RepID=UPI0019534276|nr:uncharacterized protein LOC120435088 isoform X1 [Oreochromis aureus]
MEEKKEDERWRKLFPDMKKCVIVITRTRLDQTNLSKLKEEEQGGCARSRDREQDFKLKRFVKKVEFKGQAHRASADDPRGICHRLRRSSVLWLTHCSDVISDPAHRCGLHRRRKENRCDANNNRSNRSGVEHNYCLKIKVPDTPDGNSQSQDSRLPSSYRHQDRASSCCPAEKKNLPSIVFKKPTFSPSQRPLKKRRRGCRQCVACLRYDCGKCSFCLDKKKFGGPSVKRQRCMFRRCLVLFLFSPQKTNKVSMQAGKETIMATAQPQRDHLRKEDVGEEKQEPREEEEEEEEEEAAVEMMEEVFSEGTTEKGKYYDIEVVVPGFDSDTDSI